MKVRIDKCDNPNWWYSNHIGQEYEVWRSYDYNKFSTCRYSVPCERLIDKSDCTIIEPNTKNMITIIDKRSSSGLIKMSDMKPCSFAVIEDSSVPDYNGELVMRTANSILLEIMRLKTFKRDSCWTCEPTPLVRPVEVQIQITILGDK